MRRVMAIGLAMMAMGTMGACGDGNIGDAEGSAKVGADDSQQGFLLDENSDTVLRGRFRSTDGELSFQAVSEAGELASLTFRVNGKTFDTYRERDAIIHDGHGAVLSDADHALLRNVLEHLNTRFAGTELPARIEATISMATFLNRAPLGFAHVRVVADGQDVAAYGAASLGNEGVTCLTQKGATVNAEYTDRYGKAFRTPVVVGSNWGRNKAGTSGDYSCMGACGAGCRTPRYSKDCLDHDTCSHEFNSTSGSSDPNCKDEYSAASDDTTANMFSKRCPVL
jgi:hypothetical protein